MRRATDDVVLFDEAGTNTCFAMPNLMTADFSACEVVVEHDILNQRVAVAPMEPRATAARVGGRPAHRATPAARARTRCAAQYEAVYGMTPEQVRVITPDVGGGFGAKGFPHVEELLVAELSRQVGRPVLFTETRTENMIGMVHGRGQIQNGAHRRQRATARSPRTPSTCSRTRARIPASARCSRVRAS